MPGGLNRGDGEVTLVERLRARYAVKIAPSFSDEPQLINPGGPEAADTIEALVEALEESRNTLHALRLGHRADITATIERNDAALLRAKDSSK